MSKVIKVIRSKFENDKFIFDLESWFISLTCVIVILSLTTFAFKLMHTIMD